MKRIALVTTIGAVSLGLVLTAVIAAQGPGGGLGARAGQQGQPCPYGYDQPGGQQAGWWTQVQPTTPEQTAFLKNVAQLHEQIRTKRLEVARLRAANAPQADLARAEAEVNALQSTLQDVMYQNRELRWQLGGNRMGPAWRGKGAGGARTGQPCPYGYTQAGAGMGGWWNRVTPTTPEQTAFMDSVKALHADIRAAQLELANLQAANAPQADIAKVQAKVDALRNQMQDLMYQNRELRQQLGALGANRGPRGQGAGRGQRGAR